MIHINDTTIWTGTFNSETEADSDAESAIRSMLAEFKKSGETAPHHMVIVLRKGELSDQRIIEALT